MLLKISSFEESRSTKIDMILLNFLLSKEINPVFLENEALLIYNRFY